MAYEIGSIQGRGKYRWQVVGYVNQRNGVAVLGSYYPEEGNEPDGREAHAWFLGFNRDEYEVWEQIRSLPISEEAKRELATTGQYPAHTIATVDRAHRNWRSAIGKGDPWDWGNQSSAAYQGATPLSAFVER